ncbi:MAG: TIGR04282 family arsenosugar biosynthesis glycosyltransferase, partial [Bacteroidota bacterium]
MKSDKLIIVFAKNLIEGRVKTRLARDIGDFAALEVYKELLKVTEEATANSGIETWVFYSQEIDNQQWQNSKKLVQFGNDLGEKMKNAFKVAFQAGYKSVVLIGSDLPDMNHSIISKAFSKLENDQMVFGPADDGGYYLIGLNSMIDKIFSNKPWSQ